MGWWHLRRAASGEFLTAFWIEGCYVMLALGLFRIYTGQNQPEGVGMQSVGSKEAVGIRTGVVIVPS